MQIAKKLFKQAPHAALVMQHVCMHCSTFMKYPLITTLPGHLLGVKKSGASLFLQNNLGSTNPVTSPPSLFTVTSSPIKKNDSHLEPLILPHSKTALLYWPLN